MIVAERVQEIKGSVKEIVKLNSETVEAECKKAYRKWNSEDNKCEMLCEIDELFELDSEKQFSKCVPKAHIQTIIEEIVWT